MQAQDKFKKKLNKAVRLIKSRIMRWAGHVARMGEVDVRTGFRWRDLRKRDQLEDPDVDGRKILKCILKKWDGELGTRLTWLRIGEIGGRL